MSRTEHLLSLRIATVAAVFGLLLAASSALNWARLEAQPGPEETRKFQPITVTGFAGPFGMGGKLVAGLAGLATAAASLVVFTRGRGLGLTASRWMVYCAGFFVLASYFLVRAWLFDGAVEGVLKGTKDSVPFVKVVNLPGLVVALVLAGAGIVTALAGSYVSRPARRP